MISVRLEECDGMPSRAHELITPRSAARIAGMARVAPADDLADLVEHHWIVAWDRRGQPPLAHDVLPDPCVNLAIEPAGVLLYGVPSGRSNHVLCGAGTVVGTKFRPGGFSGFVAGAVHTLNDRVLTLPEAFDADGSRLADALAETVSTPEQIEVLSAFLRARRPAPNPQRALVSQIVEAMRTAPPGTRVTEIAARFALTARTLQRWFSAHVGAGPKRVLQRFRHQHAYDRLSGDGQADAVGLARVAAELGYFDQAHFTQDFRTATGRLPSAVAGAAARQALAPVPVAALGPGAKGGDARALDVKRWS